MSFQFPPVPSLGEQVANGGVIYEWDGVKWDVYAWPEPPAPDMPSIEYDTASQIGFNLDGAHRHIDAGYAALVRVRQEPTLGAILDFHLDNWAAAGSGAVNWSPMAYLNGSGSFEGRYEMRAWLEGGDPDRGVLRFGDVAYAAYLYYDGANYSLGNGMGLIWLENNNRGVRNAAGYNNMQAWYSGADGQVHLQVDATYFGYMWFTENFAPSAYNAKASWNTNTFVKGNNQDITIYWDGANLQAFVGPTHVGQIFTTWNNTAAAWGTVVANIIASVRLAHAGDVAKGTTLLEPFPGAVITGMVGGQTRRFRYVQFLRNNGWHTIAWLS